MYFHRHHMCIRSSILYRWHRWPLHRYRFLPSVVADCAASTLTITMSRRRETVWTALTMPRKRFWNSRPSLLLPGGRQHCAHPGNDDDAGGGVIAPSSSFWVIGMGEFLSLQQALNSRNSWLIILLIWKDSKSTLTPDCSRYRVDGAGGQRRLMIDKTW